MIYLACPLTDTSRAIIESRYRAAAAATAELLSAGLIVYSPLSHGRDLEVLLADWGHADWMRHCMGVLARCDELRVLLLPGWRDSKGVTAEIEYMMAKGKRVSFMHPSAAVSRAMAAA